MSPPHTAAAPGFYRASGLVPRPMAARRASPKLPDGSALALAVRVYEVAVRQLRQPARSSHSRPSRNRPANGWSQGGAATTRARKCGDGIAMANRHGAVASTNSAGWSNG